jgi:hypothetical protein
MRVAALVTVLTVALAGRAEERPDTNYDNYKPLAEAVKKADKVVVYEGLPHPLSEKATFEAEKNKANVVRPRKDKVKVEADAHPFYGPPREVREADAKALTALVTNPDVVKPFGGNKRCGGFHPDYAVEWRAGGEAYYVEVCYGCREVKVYGPKQSLYADLSPKGLDEFKKVLAGYQKDRPGGRGPK